MIAALDEAAASIAPRPSVAAPAVTAQRARAQGTRLTRRHKLVIVGAAAATACAAIALVVLGTGRSESSERKLDAIATDAHALTAAGKHAQAIELLEPALAGPTRPELAASYLVLGHARFAVGRRLDALSAYERALRTTPGLGADPDLRTNLAKVLEGKDTLGAIVALELLASLSPVAHDELTSYASTGKLPEARRRAVMLAERDGVDAKIDRVEGTLLDLQQASSCEERKAAIQRLAAFADRRALAALKKVRSVKCVEREATDAIAHIEATK